MDTPIDYKALSATGAIMGSGGMVVMDDSTCMVNIARFFLDFTARESCGKCVPCRIGTTRMMEILNRICEGEGQEGDIELLEELCVSTRMVRCVAWARPRPTGLDHHSVFPGGV